MFLKNLIVLLLISNIFNSLTCGGWFESAYMNYDSSFGTSIKAYYKLHSSSSWLTVDSDLIRTNRVDIPGLKGSASYDLKIQGSKSSSTCTITTKTYNRDGYAHWKYGKGVGAYNNDGTLKSGITVVYVTNGNKNSVTYGGYTGIYNIFYKSKPKNVVFRFIGAINVPNGVTPYDGKSNDGSNMLYLQYAQDVTIEGIGKDCNLNRWGIEIKRSTSVEVRNLHLAKYPDDAISMTGDSAQKSKYIWIHNNNILKGYNQYAGNGIVDSDKAEGDGSTDVKWSEYVTISYNKYENCHKTSLVGSSSNHMQDWITYHHNWFYSTESRNPRVRNAHVHSYNNYFYKNVQYGIGASYDSKVFSENNYFEISNLPLDAVNMGSDKYSGTIKSYGDKFESCNMGSNLAYSIASGRGSKVSINNLKSGGDSYDNFDIDSSKIYYGKYKVSTPDNAKNEIKNYAGRMKV